ncbi:Flowering time control protein FPA [Dichanthelium oligosanthes]|uniref:Flowering time control protein FPA n=1 Tax=Dichanthelium oligosanthes TaxID=888268 RepID=A0A1E5UY71_9POAL|nr:Flowering time control protein FPA [Dichanthelium oligosanthes]
MARDRRGPGGRGRFAGGARGDERPSRHGARVEEDPYTPPPRRASGWGVAPPSRHLWVGGLAPGVTASDLSELFLRCGDVEGIARDPGRNFAFVSFRREGDAVAAVRELQGARLAGAPVRIEFSKGDKASGSSMHDRYVQYADERHSIERGRKRQPSPESTTDKSKRNRSTEPSEVLWIGFPPGLKADEALLWQAFSPFGEILRVTTFPGRTYAFVQYTSITAACRAKEALQGKLFNNPRVSICFSRNEGAAPEVGKRSFVAPYSPQPSARPVFRDQDFEAFPTARPFDSPPRDFRISSPHFGPNRLSRDSDDVGFRRDNYFQQEAGVELGRVSNIRPFGIQELGPERRMPEELYGPDRHSPTARNDAPWHNIPFERPRRPLPLEDSWDVEDNSYLISKKLRGAQVHDTELPEYPFSEFDRGKVCPDYTRRPHHDLPEDDLHSRTYPFTPMHGRHHTDPLKNLTPLVDKHEPWRAQESFARHLGEMDRSTPEHHEPALKDEWKWNGTIAKGGTLICRARCFPVGKVLNFMLPEFLDCTARTSLDMLSKHYYQAAGSWVVFFVPENDADMTAYNDFMSYLGDKQRAAVCKLGERSTLFLVPPSDFSEKVLRVPGKVSISGVILKFQQSNPDYSSPNRKSLERIRPSSASNLNTDVISREDLNALRRLNPPDIRTFPQGPDYVRSSDGSYTPASADIVSPYKPESVPPYVVSQLLHERPLADPRMGIAQDQHQQLRNMLPSGWSNNMNDQNPGSGNFSSLAQSAISRALNSRTQEPYSFATQGVPKGTSSGYAPGEASNSMSWPSMQPNSQQVARPDQPPIPVSLPSDQLAQLAALLAQQNQPGKVGLPIDISNNQSRFIQNSNPHGHATMMPGNSGSIPIQNSLPPVPLSMPQLPAHVPPIQGSLPAHPASAPLLSNTTLPIPPMHALVNPAHSSMPLKPFVPPLPEGPPPLQQNAPSAPTVQPLAPSGQQPSQQLSTQEDLDGDPQKRLQATLQLAATLLKQIQNQSNPGAQK